MAKPARQTFLPAPGKMVMTSGKIYRITEVLDLETVIGLDVESARSCTLRIADLAPAADGTVMVRDLDTIADEDWKTAQSRYAAIQPLLDRFDVGRREVEARAQEVGINFTTLYRWLKLYRDAGTLDGLMPEKRGVRRGAKKISVHAEQIIQDVISVLYLTVQRPSVQKVVLEARRRCIEAQLTEVPHPNTVRARVAEISERETLRKRGYREKAKNKFIPVPGQFPNADYPLAVVQIDHTPADIILVDDIYRKPIGRPYITMAIDVFSRMVVGYYLSFDAPSVTSVGMCVAQAILPKDDWLVLHKVDAKWPVSGLMTTIHVDNGSDFRSESFRNSCMMYNIRLEYRPVKQPRYGGHIERLLGTMLKEIHDLPGTTFSSIKERDEYDSEKHATMTKSEFETWLVTLVCKVYHKRLHSSIGMTPEKKWELGIFGDKNTPGRGMPALPANREVLLLDFLPMFKRTIQADGVSVDGLTYYADVIRQWINANDPDTPGKKRQFIFRRDPRDISVIWFHDPELKMYFRIPYADQTIPSMSIWEYQQAVSRARQQGMKSVDEAMVLQALNDLRQQVDGSSERTKKARRQQQKRKEHAKKVSPSQPLTSNRSVLEKAAPASMLLEGVVKPLDDIA
ncbi:DDE-type integrase/transposase/recombinase [Acidithiobacillus ferrooxidans]|uniref:Mu transposase C-terminal domain-containing protein n=1 Tax=Acidithiobacillus ferrooxidans TaxID=920 RepID=UPI001C078949|nr:Mu transposase C-terminal domain-containing protein [Acidithiobacillus ferrooxidans]MBU2858761.1 DDE-type integrase/transposase/recombinase [Acidithiobacillus ferrooxidans]MBU2859728.1 DDE-type integrase/transposase/recombinase [Acidithiobacillus ferrooxidans]